MEQFSRASQQAEGRGDDPRGSRRDRPFGITTLRSPNTPGSAHKSPAWRALSKRVSSAMSRHVGSHSGVPRGHFSSWR